MVFSIFYHRESEGYFGSGIDGFLEDLNGVFLIFEHRENAGYFGSGIGFLEDLYGAFDSLSSLI